MKQILLMTVVVALVGCASGSKEKSPTLPAAPMSTSWVSDLGDPNNAKIEAGIREELKKPTGKLTKADLEKVTGLEIRDQGLTDVKSLEKLTQLKTLDLMTNKLTDVKGLEKLTKLTWLGLRYNPDLTKAQIAELQKALPKCDIYSSSELTNLTVNSQPRNVNGLYRVEIIWENNANGVRHETVQPVVLVGTTNEFPMARTALVSNRWETLLPVAAAASGVTYRIRVDWKSNAIPVPEANSKMSEAFQLIIQDK